MPLVQITMAEGRTPEHKRALLAAVTQAIHDSIGAPIESVRAWVVEVEPSAFMAAGELLSERSRPVGNAEPVT